MTERAHEPQRGSTKRAARTSAPARGDRGGRKPQPATTGGGGSAGAARWVLQLQRQVGNQRVVGLLGGDERHEQREREAEAAGVAFDRGAPIAVGRVSPGGLPTETRRAAERQFGVDLGDVRVHTGPDAQAAGAAAFTVGNDVVIARSSQGNRSTARQLVGHELAHVAQQRHTGPRLQRADTPPAPATFPTLAQVITEDGDAFRPDYPQLQQRYELYRMTTAKPARPERWTRLARGSNRQLLLQILGPNLGAEVEPETADEEDTFRLSELTRPSGFSEEQERQALAELSRHPKLLERKLETIPAAQLESGELSGGHLRNAIGNVGEGLAQPLLELRLKQLQQQYPEAQIFRNVRVQLPEGTAAGGSVILSDPKEFSDGLIGRFTQYGLQVLYWLEVKGGARGPGQAATEQHHTWTEERLEEGARVILENGQSFPYIPGQPGPAVRGLLSAPRGLVTGRGAEQGGAGGGMGIAATVERIGLSQRPQDIRYLAGLLLQAMQIRHQLRQLAAQTRSAYEATSAAVFSDPVIARQILDDHSGLAVVGGRLFRLSEVGGQLSITLVPVFSLAFVYPPGAAPPALSGPGVPAPPTSGAAGAESPPAVPPPVPPQLGPGPAPPLQLGPGGPTPSGGGAPQLGPGGPGTGGPQTGGGALGGGAELTPVSPMPVVQPVAAIAHGAVPATQLIQRVAPFLSGIEGSEYLIWDAVIRDPNGRPVTGYQDRQIWTRVIRPGGSPLPESDPATGSPARIVDIRTPEGPAQLQLTPYAAPEGGVSGPARAGAGVLALLLLLNELMAPLAQARESQQRSIEMTKAQLRFYAEFGANPRYDVLDVIGNKPLPWHTTPEVGAFWGHREPRILGVDVAAFRTHLPSMINDFQSLVLFLDTAKRLGTMFQEGARYYLFLRSSGYEVTDTIERIRSSTLRAVDAEQRGRAAARGGEIFRLRTAGARVYRYSWGIPVRTSHLFLGAGAWVRPTGRSYQSMLGFTDRLQVEPANAEAQEAALNAWYLVKDGLEAVLKEVIAAGRPVLSREPATGRLIGFAAGPFPPELGATRYIRHPQNPDYRSIAIGELRQFWIDRSDLEPVPEKEVTSYARGAATAPPPSRFFQTENIQPPQE
jgi:hypothetical protein